MTDTFSTERGNLLIDGLPLSAWADRFWPKVDQSGEHWLWTKSTNGHGYGHLVRNNGFSIGAHRLSWILEHGEIPDGLKVLHHCDIRLCVRPTCLFLGTTKDNQDDAAAKRRLRRHKITPEIAQRMLELRATGLSIQAVSVEVGVSVRHTHRVLLGKHRFSGGVQ